MAENDHWRDQIARETARNYATLKRDLPASILAGLLGGIMNAVINHASIWIDAFVGVGVIIISIFLSPALVYCYSWMTAGGVDVRRRLRSIEKALIKPEHFDRGHGENVEKVLELLDVGRAFQKRLPMGRRAIWRHEAPLPLVQDFDQWRADVIDALVDWPNFQTQFSGVTAFDASGNFSVEVAASLNILLTISEGLTR